MNHQQLNNGYLFNQFPYLLLKGLNNFKSESDLLVKMARERRQDPSITHDWSIFRKVRNSQLNDQEIDKLFELLDFDESSFESPASENPDLKSIGAWFLVESIINGFRASAPDDEVEVNNYLDFIMAHCELEKALITELLIDKDFGQINAYLDTWLLTKIEFPKPSVQSRAAYACNLILHLCALIEIGLETLLETVSFSFLGKVLPQVKVKNENETLKFSSEIFLEKTKSAWAQEKYRKDKLSWSQFFRDILKAQSADETLGINRTTVNNIDNVDPDTQAIKKRFERWRKGELFTLEDFRTDLYILRVPYAHTKNEMTLGYFFVLNLFTLIQSELANNGITPREISDLFSHYDEFKSLIKTRFEQFKDTGTLLT